MSASVSAGTPRWGVQTSLIQLRQPAFWLFAALLVVAGSLFIDEQLTESKLADAYGLSWALVILYAVPVAFVVYRLDLFEREPKMMLAGALIWGGIIATSLAMNANGAWLSILSKVTPPEFASEWGPAIVGPGVEETLKLMGVVTLFLIAPREFDGVLDGFVYGAMVGLGFTVVEDVSYFISAAAVSGVVDQTGPVWDVFVIRVIGGGLYGHVLFTGLTGMGFAYLVTKPRTALLRRLSVCGLCVATGVAAHAVWNSPWMQTVLQTDGDKPSAIQWIEYGTLKGLPFLLLLGLLVVFATRSEEETFKSIVAGEPSPDIVTEPEARALRNLLARRSARSAAGKAGGRAASRLVGKLQAAQIEYAMIRSRAESPDDPAVEAQRHRIRSIRAALANLPTGAAAAAGVAAAGGTKAAAAKPAAAKPAAAKPAAAKPASAAWKPTHLVPAGGMGAWDAPDPTRPPRVMLAERLELVVQSRAGAWALVRAVNGWQGWVDGRLLVERG